MAMAHQFHNRQKRRIEKDFGKIGLNLGLLAQNRLKNHQ